VSLERPVYGSLLTPQRKSQLVIEYSYHVRSELPETWVLWVHATNVARFEESFRDIADQVKIPGRQDPQANIFKLVESWLRDKSRDKWLLILDNLDNDQLLYPFSVSDKEDLTSTRSTKPLLEYIPRSQHGSTIITSRARQIALKLVDYKDLIEVESMQRSEALGLLQRKLETPGESGENQQLVKELEFMPLAIVQAASYIRSRAPRYSVLRYLREFQKSDRKATKLLKTEVGHFYRDWEAKNSILVTWQISFDYIRERRPSAVELLSLMSFFDRQGIPEKLIRNHPEDNSGDGESSESDIAPDFEDDIMMLRDFSFITISETNSYFTMHRLVQLTMRVWLKSHGELNQWREKFISTLFRAFPNGQYEYWENCRSLFPHVKSAISQRPESPECRRQWATLLYRGAYYAWQSGNIADIREMASGSRNQREVLLGENHEEVLDSTNLLATGYWFEGQWDEAERLFVQAIEINKKTLGEDHPSMLTSLGNLASIYRNQGRWKEAEQLDVQVIRKSKILFSKGHISTLTSMGNLASTYRNQGRWKEAEQLDIQVVEISKTNLGKDHPITLASIANLSSTYSHQGRWEEAEHLAVHIMETRKIKLGEAHPSTLTSMANLALMYSNQGRWKEATQLTAQVIQTRKLKLGEDHPSTLTSIANLALIFASQGQWKKAEQLQLYIMETRKTKFGEDHPDTLIGMANLVLIFANQGRWEEAEQLQVQAMETSKTVFGENHPNTLASIGNLASMYIKLGRWEEAEQLQVQAMEANKTELGEDHPDTLTSMGNLASTFWTQGRWEDAENLEMQVMTTRKTKLGEYHPETLSSMSNLALTWKSLSRDAEAMNLLRDCLKKQKRKLGLNHPSTLSNSATLLEWEMEGLAKYG